MLRRVLMSLLLICTWSVVAVQPAAALPAGFAKQVVFSGLVQPVNVEFSSDGRVFVAEKRGIVKVFDSLVDTTPQIYADLRPQVMNYWDRGLLGMALHPNFPNDPRLYVLYSYNAAPGGTAPRWPSTGPDSDNCPSPPAGPGPTLDGCLITGRLSVLRPSGTGVVEEPLITDWCSVHPTHSVGDLKFGADGMLYASGGDGANISYPDYGQDFLPDSDHTPDNPCGDPPFPVGTALTAPSAEGGALRSQDMRTPGDPAQLDGSIIRIDPDTGQAAPGNPNAASPDENARRIVAYGFRNPFRFTTRPGTGEVWVGDVGAGTFEEINRIPGTGQQNQGWPCYEGPLKHGGYDTANLTLCETLYTEGAAGFRAPHLEYRHIHDVLAGDGCARANGSSISGLAFYNGTAYPADYRGALFFSDYARQCVWVMRPGADGVPDRTRIGLFDGTANGPVELTTGPGGDLFAVMVGTAADPSGTVVRYVTGNRPPTARLTAAPTSGTAPLIVDFSAQGSTDDDLDDLTYSWDLDGDGELDDATGIVTTWTYATAGSRTVRLRVSDGRGGHDDRTTVVNVANRGPVATISSPGPSATWRVGESIAFSGSATDPEDGTLPGSSLSWRLILHHCPTGTGCHQHEVTTYTGASGTFAAPDHEYPSWLELRLTARDSSGQSATARVELQPRTTDLTFQTSPPGLRLGLLGDEVVTPVTRRVITASAVGVTAPSPQTSGGTTYGFTSWADGGPPSRTISAPETAGTYTARYGALRPGLVAAYGFDEGAGSTAVDSSGGDLHGSVANAGWVAAGRHGKALSFNGTNSSVTVPDSPRLRPSGGLTVEAWVNPASTAGWRTAVLKERTGGLSYALYASNGSRPEGDLNLGGADVAVRGSAPPPTGTWTHLALTYDGAAIRLYVDGVQAGSTPRTGPINFAAAGPLRIGGNAVWGEYFSGLIDEVRVYDRALTAAEIVEDMATPAGGGTSDTVPPTAPGSLTATGGAGTASLAWSAAVDDGGTVAGYRVHRSVAPGFVPGPGNLIATVTGTTHTDGGLAAGAYHYRVVAVDGAGNAGPPSAEASATVTAPPGGPGLVAAYGFEEASGTGVADGSGGGNHGTTGNTTRSDQGRFGRALSFDGTSGQVTVPDSPSLRLTAGFTLSAWVRPAAVTGWRTVLFKERAGGYSYALYGSNGSGRPNAWVFDGAERNATGTAPLEADAWSHLAATYDGSTLRLYVNAVQVASAPVTGSPVLDGGALRMGGNSVWNEFFAGLIDEVRVYSDPQTPAEIAADMGRPV
ncbi:LamG-like jellyroll fold domain-containing protein [Rhizohabitans arisaemae]|uniref:LamG-like jellyroll fold domain-containing protein n=1 Tax=Rhizohabitans arisaemae TaxID=2720610 RepID=UPI0024B1DD76|nr:LamG-like jellyroll fold domain-containing protein [Rhizohabitans arisaemae]